MKIVAGRGFYDRFGKDVQAIWPDSHWSLLEPDGTWSTPPMDSNVAALIGDAYCAQFKELLLELPGLSWVHTENTGIDGAFYQEILAKKILLSSSPGTNAPEAAEFVFGVILWTVKRLGPLHLQQRQNQWSRLELDGLGNKTILVVGLGAIGGRVARIAKSFDMVVLGIRRSGGHLPGVDELGTLDELQPFLSRADIIVLALPLSPETKHLIGAAEFSVMKDTAILVNVARGGIIDMEALKINLSRRPTLQACLDAMPLEPWPENDDLWGFPNVLLTPHIAWSSPHYRPRVARIWLDNLDRFHKGKPLLHLVTS